MLPRECRGERRLGPGAGPIMPRLMIGSMGLGSSVVRLIRSLALLGVVESDADEIRAQKAALTLAAVCVTGLPFVWVGTYPACSGECE